jgi:hypothetical protein
MAAFDPLRTLMLVGNRAPSLPRCPSQLEDLTLDRGGTRQSNSEINSVCLRVSVLAKIDFSWLRTVSSPTHLSAAISSRLIPRASRSARAASAGVKPYACAILTCFASRWGALGSSIKMKAPAAGDAPAGKTERR